MADPEPLDVKIELGIPPYRSGPAFSGLWVLDGTSSDAKLDSGGGLAGPFVWTDVTADHTEATTSRSCSDGMLRTQVGTATVVLRDDNPTTARDYDPLNEDSPYYPYVGPRARIRISIDGYVVFVGDITDVPTTDIQGGQAITTVNAVEISNRLAKQTLDWVPEAVHSGAKRISRLAEVGSWDDPKTIGTGTYTFGQGKVSGNAWEAIQDVAFGDAGLAFVTRDGTLAYLARAALLGAPDCTFSDLTTADLMYDDVQRVNGFDLFYNRVNFTSDQNDKWKRSSHDNQSITEYGEMPLDFTTSLGGADVGTTRTQMKTRTNQLVGDFGWPKPRFQMVAIEARKLTKAVRDPYVITRDLGDTVTVERHPPGTGTPSNITQDCVVIGVAHALTPSSCVTTLTLTPQLA